MEEIKSHFYEEIRMAIMPERLKFLDAKYDETGYPNEYLKTYKSWMELNLATNNFKFHAFVISLIGVT